MTDGPQKGPIMLVLMFLVVNMNKVLNKKLSC